jgi:TM2 domain-containing membrane protein YozV
MIKQITTFFFIILFYPNAVSQNLFDIENSSKYASYLYKTKQFDICSSEYERLILLAPDSISFKEKLISSYKNSGQFEKGINTVNLLFYDKKSIPKNISSDYIKMLLKLNYTSKADSFLNSNINLPEIDKNEFKLAILILENKYSESYSISKSNYFETPKYKLLRETAFDASKFKKKRPVLAASLSTIIPGLGKFYTKDYKDGFVLLSIIAINSWQTYRIYNKIGTQNFYFWTFGVLSAGFYLGNIYGAFTSAKRYNEFKQNEIRSKALNIIFED